MEPNLVPLLEPTPQQKKHKKCIKIFPKLILDLKPKLVPSLPCPLVRTARSEPIFFVFLHSPAAGFLDLFSPLFQFLPTTMCILGFPVPFCASSGSPGHLLGLTRLLLGLEKVSGPLWGLSRTSSGPLWALLILSWAFWASSGLTLS